MSEQIGNWSIGSLFQASFRRLKDRLIPVLLVGIMSIPITILCGIGTAVLVGIGILLFFVTKSAVISIAVIGLAAVISFTLTLYMFSWIHLAYIQAAIRPTRAGPITLLKETHVLVWQYVVLSLLMVVFFVGLLPFGMLSLGIIFVLWGVWAVFVPFVFIRYRPKGLGALWISRNIAGQRFWSTLLRLLALNAVIIAIHMAVAFLLAQINEGLSGYVFSIIAPLTTFFSLCFLYEMFQALPQPSDTNKPKIWIGLAALGFFMTIASVILMFSQLSQVFDPSTIEQYKDLFISPNESSSPVFMDNEVRPAIPGDVDQGY